MAGKTIKLTQTDLENIAKGAAFLASGGGGTYESGKNLSNYFYQSEFYTDPTFEVADIDNIDSDGYGVVVAYIGAPEAIKTVKYPIGAVRAVEQVKKKLSGEGKTLKYVVPVEIGALSSVVPCLVASHLGLTVVNGDGAGRAVPELTMLSFSSSQISCNPTILANSSDFLVDLAIDEENSQGKAISDASAVEQIARQMLDLEHFNNIAGLAMWVMSPQQMGKAIQSTGSLTLARDVGEIISSSGLDDVISHLRSKGKKVYKLFDGAFDPDGSTSLTAGGFDHGSVTISNGEEKFINIYQNESLLGWSNTSSQPLAMAPDSIAFYVHDDQKVYSVGDVMDEDGQLAPALNGKPVSVIGIAAEAFLRNDNQKDGLLPVFEALLNTLGYYGKYQPIEQLHTNR